MHGSNGNVILSNFLLEIIAVSCCECRKYSKFIIPDIVFTKKFYKLPLKAGRKTPDFHFSGIITEVIVCLSNKRGIMNPQIPQIASIIELAWIAGIPDFIQPPDEEHRISYLPATFRRIGLKI
jgi:hypothetical protein